MRVSTTYIDNNGYLRFRDSKKLVHRWAMEKKLGRPLQKGEIVHHINGEIRDNRPENLELLNAKEHYKKHVVPILEARREAQISEHLSPIFEDRAIKSIFLGFAFFGALLFTAGLIIRANLQMWYIGLLFLIMGLAGCLIHWLIQRANK